ncbi:MAG: protease modulator HflC [Alphaproteobacteria bacterium BRH_c36]|nr:MAG: protease modulator HflC [Alphaproteobacteria bacterium BRH_c36]
MRTFSAIVIVLLLLAAAALYMSAFMVRQTEQALLLQFGEVKDVINEYELDSQGRFVNDAGLNWKIPVVQEVIYYDKRVLDLDSQPLEVIVSDQKRLVVDAFLRYRITNPLKFYQTVRTEAIARQRLGNVVEASVRSVLGAATFQDVVRDKREALMTTIRDQVNREAETLGVSVIDVRIKRADLPEANSEAIYRRMQTEREREATEIRSEGNAAANRIRATADREATVIKAEATRKSEQMRGEGDAERNRVFAEAFGRDPEFFAFYRSMQAYEAGLGSKDTRLVITPDSEFFRFFNNPGGTTSPAN